MKLRTAVLVLAGAVVVACGGTKKSCDPASCSSGCCDANGDCQPGTAPAACGVLGQTCSTCSGAQSCQMGKCGTNSGVGGGSGGSTGGGSGGGVTGGGSGGGVTGGGSGGGGSGGGVTGGGSGGGVTGGGSGGGATGGGSGGGAASNACLPAFATATGCTTFTDLTDAGTVVNLTWTNPLPINCVRVRQAQRLNITGVSSFHPFSLVCGPATFPTQFADFMTPTVFPVGTYGFYCPNHGTTSGTGMAGMADIIP